MARLDGSCVAVVERFIMENSIKDPKDMSSKSDIARRCDTSPQHVHYIYKNMVSDGKITDYYRSMKKAKREGIIQTRADFKEKQKTEQRKRTYVPTDIGMFAPSLRELVMDMEGSQFQDEFDEFYG